jgi:hypothetical protein
MSEQTYPFSLNEATIHDLIELIEDAYCPSDKLEAFLKELEKRRDQFVEERISRLDYDLMRHLEDSQ